ncbi:MAG: hypothetical protein HY695_01360 [Deltaproteobacteria bacterium]|nr:hypothetical protein [Deltaproteobacteria bacterium]
MLVFLSGLCLEIAAMPYLLAWFGRELAGPVWVLSVVFSTLGLVGLYASKFGNDRLVESLLVVPKLGGKRK